MGVQRATVSSHAIRSVELRPLLAAMEALRDGDFRVRLPMDHDGMPAELAAVFNQIADRNLHFAEELSRVRREVVREGRLDERLADSPGQGAWAATVGAANSLVDVLVVPTANATRVLEAVAGGDLTQRVDLHDDSRPLRGSLRRLGQTVNQMVDQLSLFTGEVTRVAREVGAEGRLGGRAKVNGLTGSWRDVTEAVNTMAARLTAQVRDIAVVTTAVARGDLTRSVTVEATGELLELKLTVNTMVDQLSAFADEVTRVAREVGTEGQLGGQAQVRGVSGVWKGLTDNVNFMALNLTTQVRNIAEVTTSVANGDLSKQITVDAQGEILQLKNTVNTMVDQLSAFADEVTRVAREVGTDGRLGGRAHVRGVSGVWKDLTDNVNFMADNLTSQVRNIAQVATAVAQGDLGKKIDVDARGEILELKSTINTMVDTLSSFSSEVTRVAREVGTEGNLGGQAQVRGVSGVWKDLTDNVNELALNLTTQVRAIAEVTSAVTQGDMSRTITVETRGEVSELKDNINQMVSNLRETTRAKDWLESNLTRLAGLMQGHRDLTEVADLVLRELTPLVNAQYGAFFLADTDCEGGPGRGLAYIAGYGSEGRTVDTTGMPGPGLVQQAVREKKRILMADAPPDYITIRSGLGESTPTSVVIIPIPFEDKVLGVIELASFSRFSDVHLAFFDQFVDTIGVAINTIIANSRTEALLSESQRLTTQLQDRSKELQRQQAELQRSNEQLAEKAALLSSASQYKSEFLANMSHELRSPLSSLLIYARLLADNAEGHLSSEEEQFAQNIYWSGSDLLQLINDILDLSKVEAGRMDIRPKYLPLARLLDYVNATFRPIATEHGLDFDIEVSEDAPHDLYSDGQRLQQILRNLLSNAFKFTSEGHVKLRLERAADIDDESLGPAENVIAFTVEDTGIGIPSEKLTTIFEAFEQVHGPGGHTSGTGLGLSISRELAGLLGGKIVAESGLGRGSKFTLYVPVVPPLPEDLSEQPPDQTEAATFAPTQTKPGPAEPTPGEPRPVVAVPDGHPIEPAAQRGPADRTVRPDGTDERKSGPPADPLSGAQVLIVDDDVRLVTALTHVLGRAGMSVLHAPNGEEGIEVLTRHPQVSLVLMDIMMPVMDGYEAMRAIRSDPRHVDLPIIALTAKVIAGERERAIAAGANEYVHKPADVNLLLSVARDLLDTDGAERQ
ncbi:HAMP domain-containing protein [Nonomuraea sp. NPDC049695]|uniref:HAMP domain-containing protein n=1 Tax=Nonomuraea sp. NPDC049695 TaxID=3154734 RepID=UPI003440E194